MTNRQAKNIIQTTRGEIPAEKITNYKICLFHQQLSPYIYQKSCERTLTMQNLNYHISNPLSLQNSAITAGLLDHELVVLGQANKINPSDIIILDGSNYKDRVPQICEKYTVLKGYSYRLDGIPSEEQKNVLLSQQHITKQLEFQFSLGNGKFKPGFIGQISLEECVKNSDYCNAYRSYVIFASKTKCPIIINALSLGQPAVSTAIQSKQSAADNQYLNNQQKYGKIIEILQISKQLKASTLCLYNLPFTFITTLDQNTLSSQTVNQMHKTIIRLLSEYDFMLGFDLTKYNRRPQAIHYIALLALNYPNRIILSSGLRYKTDLSVFGGQGYQLYNQNGETFKQIEKITGRNILEQILHTNKLKLVCWKVRMEEIKIVVTWKCNQCGVENVETVQSFRKFGKQFCSIKCLKSHNS